MTEREDREALRSALITLENWLGDRRSTDRVVEAIFTIAEAQALVEVARCALAAGAPADGGGDRG